MEATLAPGVNLFYLKGIPTCPRLFYGRDWRITLIVRLFLQVVCGQILKDFLLCFILYHSLYE